MRKKLLSALAFVVIPSAALATPMPRASNTPGVGTDNWAECTTSDRALEQAPNIWRVSWHACFPIF